MVFALVNKYLQLQVSERDIYDGGANSWQKGIMIDRCIYLSGDGRWLTRWRVHSSFGQRVALSGKFDSLTEANRGDDVQPHLEHRQRKQQAPWENLSDIKGFSGRKTGSVFGLGRSQALTTNVWVCIVLRAHSVCPKDDISKICLRYTSITG